MENEEFGLSNLEIEEQVRVKVNRIPVVNYTPKLDSKLWFMNHENDNLYENKENNLKVADRNKKNSIKNTQYRVDHLYSKGEYLKCIEELNYLKTLVKLKKKQDYTDDIIDTEIRCNFKLAQYDTVIELVNKIEKTLQAKNNNNNNNAEFIYKDWNLLILLATSYHQKQNIQEAKTQYQRCIAHNHRIWEWWLNLSLTYLNCSTIITKQNLMEFINSDNGINEIKLLEIIKFSEITNTNKVLAYRSVCHGLFILTQSIHSKRSFKNTTGYKQLENMKSLLEHLSKLIGVTDEQITNSIQSIKIETNQFENKWLVDFKVENWNHHDDDEVEDREENPFTL